MSPRAFDPFPFIGRCNAHVQLSQTRPGPANGWIAHRRWDGRGWPFRLYGGECAMRRPAPLVSSELGQFLALQRATTGRIVLHAHELFTDHGRRIPDYLNAPLRELLAHGYLELHTGLASGDQHRVMVTQAGEGLSAKFVETRRYRDVPRPPPCSGTPGRNGRHHRPPRQHGGGDARS